MRKLIYGALALSAAMAVGFGVGAKDAKAAVSKKAPAASDIALDGNQLTIKVDGATSATDIGKVFVGVPKFTKGSGANNTNSLVSVPSWDEYDYNGGTLNLDTTGNGTADAFGVTIDISAYPNNKDAYLMVKYDTAKDSEATLIKIPKSDVITKAEYVPVTDKTKADEAEILIKNGATSEVKNANVFYYTALQNTTVANPAEPMESDVPTVRTGKGSSQTAGGDGKYLFKDPNVLKSFENTGAAVYFYVQDTPAAATVGQIGQGKVDSRILYMGSYDSTNKFIQPANPSNATDADNSGNFVVTPKRPSKAVKTTIPKRSDAPKLTVDYVNGTIKIPAKCEYAFFDQYTLSTSGRTNDNAPADNIADDGSYVKIGDTNDDGNTENGRKDGIGFTTAGTPTTADITFKLGYDNATPTQKGLKVYGDFYLDYKGIAKTGKYKDLYTKPARVLFDGLVDTDVTSVFAAASGTTGTIASGASKDEKGEKDSLPITVTLKYNKSKLNYDVVVANHNIDAAYTVRVATQKLDYAVKTLGAATAQGSGTSRAFKAVKTLTVKTSDVRDASDFKYVRVYVQKQGNKKTSKWLQREVFVEKTSLDSAATFDASNAVTLRDGTTTASITTEDIRQKTGTYGVDHTGNSNFDFQVSLHNNGETDAIPSISWTNGTPANGIDDYVKVYFQGIKGTGYNFTAIGAPESGAGFNKDNKLVVGSKILITCNAPDDDTATNERKNMDTMKDYIENKIQVIEESTKKQVTISRGVLNDAGNAYVYTITMPADNIVIVKK